MKSSHSPFPLSHFSFLIFHFSFFLSLVGMAGAQNGVFLSREQPHATLPSRPQGLSVVDNDLCLYASEIFLKACRQGSDVMGFMADTEYVKLDENINYVVRHPSTGDLYFTRLDRKGRSVLYCSHRDGKRVKTKQLKMDDIEVEHPTFSSDGKVMVFSSVEPRRSYGGYDLWYSTLKGGDWSSPVNIGNRVNTQGDEVTPCIVGDYLFFSSNGRDESRKHLNIYATRLIARQVMGDTIGMLQIGRSRVQQLPQGINSAVSDCYDFVIDPAINCCYWVNSSSGLRSYCGTLDAVTLWGYAHDSHNKPLSGVSVTALEAGKPVAMASSRSDGFYKITLPVGGSYDLRYSLPLHFSHLFQLTPEADKAGNLIGEARHEVTLDKLPVGQQFFYYDLFGPDAVVNLSSHGEEVLERLVQFLTDNPTLSADLTLSCDLTDNAEFNALLTEQRLDVLTDYLRSRLPATVTLLLKNGCEGQEGCSDATGENRLAVFLRNEK